MPCYHHLLDQYVSFERPDKLVRILGFAAVLLIDGTATALAYYFLWLVLGAMLAPSVAKPLAIGLASLLVVVSAVVWYQIVVQGRLPGRLRHAPFARRPSGR